MSGTTNLSMIVKKPIEENIVNTVFRDDSNRDGSYIQGVIETLFPAYQSIC